MELSHGAYLESSLPEDFLNLFSVAEQYMRGVSTCMFVDLSESVSQLI